jgi:hypothetical protein
MKRSLVISVLSCTLICICGCGPKPTVFEAAKGVYVQVSDLSFSKAQGKVFGYVQIVNKSDNFAKVSNKELCLIYKSDTVRAFMKIPGEWEIDKGLVNIMKGKDLEYQACWPIKDCNVADIKFAYLKVLPRDGE